MAASKRTLKVPGRDDPTVPVGAIEQLPGGIEVAVRKAIRVEAARAGDEIAVPEVAGDDVVAVRLEDGIRLWTTGDLLADDLAEAHGRARGGAEEDDGTLVLPAYWPTDSAATRGAGTLLIQGLELLDVDLKKLTALALAKKIENAVEEPGLHRWAFEAALSDLPRGGVPVDAPALVFLHGTGSRTLDSFGALLGTDLAAQLAERYGERVYGFEHRSLSQSPIENALELAKALPAGARVDLVSHSRGGLVGELLCRGQRIGDEGPYDPLDLGLFEARNDAGARRRDLKALAALDDQLRDKRIRVGRFGRVACPAAGTLLASGRLDRYLSLILNLIETLPGLGLSTTYEVLKTLVLGVAQQRTEPEVLPGIEAMMPDSPLVAMLNRPDVEVAGRLAAIAGDIQGRGFFDRLKVIGTNLFYREDHDLVVHTGAMYGGAARSGDDGWFLFDQGAEVNHFNYFQRDVSRDALGAGLLEDDLGDPERSKGLRPLAERDPAPAGTGFFDILLGRGAEGEAAIDRPVVFVLPGIMGSNLQAGDQRLWLAPKQLAKGRIEDLAIEAPDISALSVLERAYGRIIRFLGERHEVIPFPYDWRLSLRDEAHRLGDAVALVLERTDQPVRLLAHSMGGLLARAMIARRPEVWQALASRDGGRLVMLGTPNRGSQVITRVLAGRERMVRLLAKIDLHHKRKPILDIVRRFPGLLELLPMAEQDPGHEEADAQDYFAQGTWRAFAAGDDDVVAPTADDLRHARKLDALLDERTIDEDRMVYVAGQAPATPIRARLEGRRLVFDATPRGDGRVTWRTGLLDGVRTYFMPGVRHGRLADHKPSFAALDELLGLGTTDKLPVDPPAARSSQVFVLRGDDAEVGPDAVVMFPDAAELEAAAVGGEPVAPVAAEPRVEIKVEHGDLAHCLQPVTVGHYQDSEILAAEGALDRSLDGRLRALDELGLYPGTIGAADVVLADEGMRPGGAVVVGLGRIGKLDPGDLTESFAQGALRYAVRALDQARERDVEPPDELALASVLIGSGEGGMAIADSLVAMLEGVLVANRRLTARDGAAALRIGSLILVELYEDRAVQAFHSLCRLIDDPRFVVDGEPAFALDVAGGITTTRGGLRRVFVDEDPSWWRRIEIVGDQAAARVDHTLARWWQAQRQSDDPKVREAARLLRESYEADAEKRLTPLSFTALTDRARAEVLPLGVDRAWADRLIERAVRTIEQDEHLAATLFELLLPNGLKARAPDNRGVVLLVDAEAARYPWELLTDRAGEEPSAPALTGGVVRQLATGRFRAKVETVTRRNAFVVGDPPTGRRDLPRLPGARREAETVARKLEQAGFEVVAKTRDPSPREVLEPLVPPGFRILHLAGHGEYDRERPERSGMVLRDGLVLSPAIVEQMRPVPELVFVNCCHLGYIEEEDVWRTGPDRHRLAANLGMQFIEMGAKAVIAAGWAVDDRAALEFAEVFYRRMLQGTAFGVAVTAARNAAHGVSPALNTWAAYQCYGDPYYCLVGRSKGGGGDRPFANKSEVLAALANLEAGAATSRDTSWIAGKLSTLGGPARRWWNDPQVLIGRARVHAELKAYGEAVGCYERAAKAARGVASIRDLEQLANMRARWGAELVLTSRRNGDGEQEKQGLAQIAEAIGQARQVLELHPTVERRSILAAAFKRRALVTRGAVRRRVLKQMLKQYEAGLALSREHAGGDPMKVDTYPWLNAWTGRILCGVDVDENELVADLARIREIALRKRMVARDFWTAMIEVDAAVVGHLHDGLLADSADTLVGNVLRAWRPACTQKEIASVIENLVFIQRVWRGDDATRDALADILRRLEEAARTGGG